MEKIKPKKSFFAGVKSEFKKIVWPTKEEIIKETVAVTIIGVILGALTGLLDFAFNKLFGLFIAKQ